MIKVKVKAILEITELVGSRQQVVEVDEASTVSDLLKKLVDMYGEALSNRLFQDSGKLRGDIMLMVNGRNIDILDGLETELNSDDELLFFPPVGGG